MDFSCWRRLQQHLAAETHRTVALIRLSRILAAVAAAAAAAAVGAAAVAGAGVVAGGAVVVVAYWMHLRSLGCRGSVAVFLPSVARGRSYLKVMRKV